MPILAVAALLASLVALGVSLIVYRASPAELQSELRQLALDVTELYDKIEHWTRRERVRRLREGQEGAAAARAAEVPASATDRKAQLRARLRAGTVGVAGSAAEGGGSALRSGGA